MSLNKIFKYSLLKVSNLLLMRNKLSLDLGFMSDTGKEFLTGVNDTGKLRFYC
jgi:hypothetical protein